VHPFIQKKINNVIVREFSKNTNTEDLVWHRDRENRDIKVVEGFGWMLQMDNSIPVMMNPGKKYYIPKNTYHRIIKGSTDLVLEIREQKKSTLQEGMVPPGSLGDSFAVWSNWYEESEPPPGAELNFILYNKNSANETVAGMDKADVYDTISVIDDNAVAAIRARVPDAGYGECNQAWEIIRSAADKGYGPTLYDLVMSVAPNGLTPDRSEVSQAARAVWLKYANDRSGVDKKLLDPNGIFTWSEEDDCTMQGSGSTWSTSPLPKLHNQMAVDFLEDYYPVEYEEWQEEQDPQQIEYLRDVDGNDYWEAVSKWVEENAGDRDYEDWDIDQANDDWFEWKTENEPNLIDNLEDSIESPQQLNMSYNTEYAADIMSDLIGNHYNWVSYLEDTNNWEDSLDEEALGFAVRDFFNEKYR